MPPAMPASALSARLDSLLAALSHAQALSPAVADELHGLVVALVLLAPPADAAEAKSWLGMPPSGLLPRLRRFRDQRLGQWAATADTRNRLQPLVAVVDPEEELLPTLEGPLREAGYRLQTCRDDDALQQWLEDPKAEPPAVVVWDLPLEQGQPAMQAIAEVGVGAHRGIPLLAVSHCDRVDTRLQAMRHGACCYWAKPLAVSALLEQLEIATARQPETAFQVLVVDDDPLVREALTSMLESAGMGVSTLADPLALFERVDATAPDAVILDAQLPGANGVELSAILRQRQGSASVPVVVLGQDERVTESMLAHHLSDLTVLPKPVEARQLRAVLLQKMRKGRRQQQLRQHLQASRYENERIQQALNEHAIVSIADRAGNITYANDLFCQISGFQREELLGKNHRIIKSNRHPPAFYKELWHQISQGRIWRGDICNLKKSGKPYWVSSTIVPFLDQAGEPYQYVSIRTDITWIKEAETTLRRKSQLQNIVSETAADLLAAPGNDMDWVIDQVLRKVGEYLGANRSYLYLYSDDGTELSNTHEWVGPGAEPRKALDQQRPLSLAPWWQREISAGRPALVVDREQMPEGAQAEKALMAERQACAMIGMPLQKNTKTYGFIGFDSAMVKPEWAGEEMGLLRLLANVISSAMAKYRVEKALEENKERLRRGQMFANIGTWDWHIATGELYWSERIAPLFGYGEGELETSYANFMAAVHPEDRVALESAVNAALNQEEPYELEHRVIWPDGTVRWLLERGAVIRDAAGKPERMIGVVQDIDDRKRAELALVERDRQLQRSQELAHIGNWRADLRSGELEWSPEIFRIFGYPPDSFQPRIEDFHRALHPDDRDKVLASELKATHEGIHDVVHRIIRPDGSIRHVHELAQAEYDSAGKMVMLTGTVQDITEQVEAEQALIHARDEAERANRAKSDFLSSMSHELRTPMNAIIGFSQLLEQDDALNEDQQENVAEILKGARHLLTLINEVLDLAKIEAGRIELQRETVVLAPVIEEVLSLVKPLAVKRGISLHSIGDQRLAVVADSTRLKQVLLNLLSNAIKYNRDDGEVRVVVQAEAQRVCVAVEDTGVGIAPEQLSELFQPFNRLDADNTEVEGTGIGLSLSKRLIELMGGEVAVDSEVGTGSQFALRLPRAQRAAAAVATEPQADAEDESRDEPSAAPQLVLYVEDNPANLKLVAQIFQRYRDVELITAHLPELGLELARVHQPDLILLDINMPGMDGYALLKTLQNEPALAAVPVVAITANAMPHDVERGLQAGFREYLTKPLDVSRFTQMINRELGAHVAIQP